MSDNMPTPIPAPTGAPSAAERVEPASYLAALETRARCLAADKMGLINDPEGERLPAELWRQCLPQARANLPMAAHYEAEDCINDPRALQVYTACEWYDLGEDGRVWMSKVIEIAQERALARAAALAPHPPAGAVAGHVLVPVEPTEALFDRLHIEALVREWCAGTGSKPHMAPHLVEGLVDALRRRLGRSDFTTERAERLVRRVEGLLQHDLKDEVRERLVAEFRTAALARTATPSPHAHGAEAEAPETFASIAQWCEDTFGPITPERIASRAAEEMDELRAEPSKVEEAADVVIVLSRFPGLWDEVQRKMRINRGRTWRLMGDGTGYHVKHGDAALADPGAGRAGEPSDDELLDDFAIALTAENPAHNELRDARAAVISRMKGAGK